MGPALQNLDHLLDLPFGCGEQNMVQFAPNIFILQYLNKTKQLDPEIEDKALIFLRTGKHHPSSFCCKMKVLYIKSVGHWSGGDVQGGSGSTARAVIKEDITENKGNVSWKEKHVSEEGCLSLPVIAVLSLLF